MKQLVTVPADTPRTASFVLTIGIVSWLASEASRRGMSVSSLIREILEQSMTDRARQEDTAANEKQPSVPPLKPTG